MATTFAYRYLQRPSTVCIDATRGRDRTTDKEMAERLSGDYSRRTMTVCATPLGPMGGEAVSLRTRTKIGDQPLLLTTRSRKLLDETLPPLSAQHPACRRNIELCLTARGEGGRDRRYHSYQLLHTEVPRACNSERLEKPVSSWWNTAAVATGSNLRKNSVDGLPRVIYDMVSIYMGILTYLLHTAHSW